MILLSINDFDYRGSFEIVLQILRLAISTRTSNSTKYIIICVK